MKEYVLTEKDIEYLRKALYSPTTIYRDPNLPDESIMIYNLFKGVCECDDGYLCEHRLEWLIEYIENKELKTRKTKIDKLNEV